MQAHPEGQPGEGAVGSVYTPEGPRGSRPGPPGPAQPAGLGHERPLLKPVRGSFRRRAEEVGVSPCVAVAAACGHVHKGEGSASATGHVSVGSAGFRGARPHDPHDGGRGASCTRLLEELVGRRWSSPACPQEGLL